MNKLLLLFGVVVLTFSCPCWSANILAFLPTFARSHYGAFQPMLKELAVRGHNLTVLSHFPLKDPPPNYHHIDVSMKKNEFAYKNKNDSILNKVKFLKPLTIPIGIIFLGTKINEQTLNNKKVQEFIEADGYQFDLVIFENFQHECFVAMGHKYGAPVVQLIPATPTAFVSQWHSQPFHPAYIPDQNSGFTDRMPFFDRLTNVLVALLQLTLYPLFYMPKQTEIMNKYFNYTGWETRPTLEEMTKNISLTLMNAHFTIGSPRPLVPSFVQVAGMHLKPASPLPNDLQEIMDNSPNGVVYFSFGSVVQAMHLPKETVTMFLRQLGKLKQTVLWKWESTDLPELPANVIVRKWFPQVDILGHPNCTLFITHGGVHSTVEAVYYGVPMLAIAIFGDQWYNSIMMQTRGAAIRIKYTELTEDIFEDSLIKILNDKTYQVNAKELSRRFKDQPLKPVDRAVYWIEYVIRHKGAHHLKTAANNLNWFQLLLIDVVGVILISLFIFIYLLKKILKLCCYCITRRSKIDSQKKSQ
ncbi:UDP-glucosyltransferase 2-like isoform X2 [Adelges cooleyi]|nr:UDP-glucosyltransferase 2-like isoform X2 [Adelges cooleyi]XP_050432521.1 UDP-glucosyltransferase 2-like isoform X2 [Adelges cooleyi]XP_050432522.1 UDP-glucosyltransferase 2-like isoform X2 [Adelges cooleyi]XP_050432523.1 UDP-glucosyltransferase 2-like isoform X2 [Adelges cooleyi]